MLLIRKKYQFDFGRIDTMMIEHIDMISECFVCEAKQSCSATTHQQKVDETILRNSLAKSRDDKYFCDAIVSVALLKVIFVLWCFESLFRRKNSFKSVAKANFDADEFLCPFGKQAVQTVRMSAETIVENAKFVL